MPKQQNTQAKCSREVEKKRKADQKRERRNQRRQDAPVRSDPAHAAENQELTNP